MANFDLIKTVTDIRSEIQASSAYSHDSITEQCGLEKEVWIVSVSVFPHCSIA